MLVTFTVAFSTIGAPYVVGLAVVDVSVVVVATAPPLTVIDTVAGAESEIAAFRNEREAVGTGVAAGRRVNPARACARQRAVSGPAGDRKGRDRIAVGIGCAERDRRGGVLRRRHGLRVAHGSTVLEQALPHACGRGPDCDLQVPIQGAAAATPRRDSERPRPRRLCTMPRERCSCESRPRFPDPPPPGARRG